MWHAQNLELVRRVQSLADKKGVTAGQLALAWVMYRGDDVIPIPGTRRIKYLEENVGAAHVTLSPEDLEALEAAVPRGSVGSQAYPLGGHVSTARGLLTKKFLGLPWLGRRGIDCMFLIH